MDRPDLHTNHDPSTVPAGPGCGGGESDFEHFLITRFNIPLNHTNQRFDEQALRERIALFEQFCYPSVAGQTNRNFKWLVIFDQDSPQFLTDKIESYRTLKNFIPVFGEKYSRKYVRSVIAEHLGDSVRYLITSRLDNDDAIGKNFIKIVQEHFDRQELRAINLQNGYCWENQRIYYNCMRSNPFISLIERVKHPGPDGFYSVYFKMHEEIDSVVPTLSLSTEPAWIMCIHGKNLANRRGGYRLPIQQIHKHFTLHLNDPDNTDNLLLCCCQWPVEVMRKVRRKLHKMIRSQI